MPPTDDISSDGPAEFDGPASSGAGPSRVPPFQGAANAPRAAANDESLLIQINALEQEHADLHTAIDALADAPGHDPLTVARLKKKKLKLKDRIEFLRDRLTPDIIA